MSEGGERQSTKGPGMHYRFSYHKLTVNILK